MTGIDHVMGSQGAGRLQTVIAVSDRDHLACTRPQQQLDKPQTDGPSGAKHCHRFAGLDGHLVQSVDDRYQRFH